MLWYDVRMAGITQLQIKMARLTDRHCVVSGAQYRYERLLATKTWNYSLSVGHWKVGFQLVKRAAVPARDQTYAIRRAVCDPIPNCANRRNSNLAASSHGRNCTRSLEADGQLHHSEFHVHRLTELAAG